MNVMTIGLDIAKQVFQVHGVDRHGQVVLRKQLKRAQGLAFFANLPACRVGLEAGASAHYWARELFKLGHEARLISPQFVKPYVKGNKNDANDAEAIGEAVGRPNMRFVPGKRSEQQDILRLDRLRQGLVKERTALANQTRGLLGEYGIVMGQGLSQVCRRLPEILEDGDNALSVAARAVFAECYDRLVELDRPVKAYTDKLHRLYRASAACQQVGSVPGIGPITATALVATLGDGKAFKKARQVSAWLGVVPKQDSSSDKPKLLGISNRGGSYLRTLLIPGARAVLKAAAKKDDAYSRWIKALVTRRNANLATVAVANKHARVSWALLPRHETYRVPTMPAAR